MQPALAYPSAEIKPDGFKPSRQEIEAVARSGRCFLDPRHLHKDDLFAQLDAALPSRTRLVMDSMRDDEVHMKTDAVPSEDPRLQGKFFVSEEAKQRYIRRLAAPPPRVLLEAPMQFDNGDGGGGDNDGSDNGDDDDPSGPSPRGDGAHSGPTHATEDADDAEDADSADETALLCPTFDDLRDRGAMDGSFGALEPPVVLARGSPPIYATCFQCGTPQSGFAVQSIAHIYWTAIDARPNDELAVVTCLTEMAALLRSGRDHEVASRTACCANIDCMIRAHVMTVEYRDHWLYHTDQRKQAERPPPRLDQHEEVRDILEILRSLVVQGALDLEDVKHLVRYTAMNSQFVQEREKRFAATAMAVVENENLMGFKFPDAQRFVDRMSGFIHGYFMNVLVPLVMDTTSDLDDWRATLNKLLRTALAKAADAVYALMVEANAETRGFPIEPAAPLPPGHDDLADLPFGAYVQQHGRIAHVVPESQPELRQLFEPREFTRRLRECVKASPEYEFKYVSAARDAQATTRPKLRGDGRVFYDGLRVSTNGGSGSTSFDVVESLRRVAGRFNQKETAKGCGQVDVPTSGDLALESNVHTRMRYHNLFIGLGFAPHEAEQRVAMMLTYHPPHNTVGLEWHRNGKGRKKCYVLRLPSPAVATTTGSLGAETLSSVAPPAEAVRTPHAAPTAFDSLSVRAMRRSGAAAMTSPKDRHVGSGLGTDPDTHASAAGRQLALHLAETPLPTLELKAYRRAAEQAVGAEHLDWEARCAAVERQTWTSWWAAWTAKRPSNHASDAVRRTVERLHHANEQLNAFAREFGGGGGGGGGGARPDVLEYHTRTRSGVHGDAATLASALTTLHNARAIAHPLVEYLVNEYGRIAKLGIIFVEAHEQSKRERSVVLVVAPTVSIASSSEKKKKEKPERSHATTAEVRRIWAVAKTREQLKRDAHERAFRQSGYTTKRAFCAARGIDYATAFLDLEKRDRQDFHRNEVEKLMLAHDVDIDRLQKQTTKYDTSVRSFNNALQRPVERDPSKIEKPERGRRYRPTQLPAQPIRDGKARAEAKNERMKSALARAVEVLDVFKEETTPPDHMMEAVQKVETEFMAAMQIKYGSVRSFGRTYDHNDTMHAFTVKAVSESKKDKSKMTWLQAALPNDHPVSVSKRTHGASSSNLSESDDDDLIQSALPTSTRQILDERNRRSSKQARNSPEDFD